MMMSDDAAVRWDALALVNTIIAHDEATEDEGAVAFVGVCFDTETGRISHFGPFADVVGAMKWAGPFEAGLNSGLIDGEDPWIVKVYPVTEPEQ